MIKYNYNNIDSKFLENGHTMFEGDVLLRLRRLADLEEQIKQGQLLPIDSVSESFTEKQKDDAYDKGYEDGATAENEMH
jgi:hypothetical protein